MMSYQVGGSLHYDASSYVRRQADRSLYEALLRREFCYVLDSRQMGKSSLLVRVQSQLQQAGGRCATLDLTTLGSGDVTPEQWYKGIGAELCLSFELLKIQQFLTWWQQQGEIPYLQKLARLIAQVLLPRYPQTPLYIFVDEVDSILSLRFSADDLFALIRYCYNRRALEIPFRQLTFAIAGVASPPDLIIDKSRTPFNIGYGIELKGFQLEEVGPLTAGLQHVGKNANALMAAILDWTGGQPFLTQKLCRLVAEFHQPHTESASSIPQGMEAAWVQGLVYDFILHNWEAHDEPEHLRSIRDRILQNQQQAGRLLSLYQTLLSGQPVPTDGSREQVELLLSGLVIQRLGSLHIKNQIYQSIFDIDWVTRHLAKLRPYSQDLTAWTASNQTDRSRLLQGQALQDAQQWARDKSLDECDYQFLVASEALDRHVVQQQLEAARVKEVEARLYQERRALRLQRSLLRVISIALLATVSLGLTAFWQYRQAIRQEQQAEQETVRTLATSAKALLASDQRLDALVAAVRAKQRFSQLLSPTPPLGDQVTAVLRQTLFNATEVNRLSSHEDVVNDVAFSPDGKTLASVSPDRKLLFWQRDGSLIETVQLDDDEPYALDYSPTGELISIAYGGKTVEIRSATGQKIRSLIGHGATVWFSTFGPKGELIASASQDSTVRLWSSDGQLLQTFKGHTGPAYGADISPDRQLVASASTDGTAKIWQRDGRLQTTLVGHAGAVWAVAFSPTRDVVVTTGQDQTVRLWKTDGTPIKTLTGHTGAIWGVTFSPDGSFFVSTSVDGTARVWSEDGSLLETLSGHEGTIWGVDVSPDSSTIATASWDQTIRLWQRQHPLKQTLYTSSDAVTHLDFSASGDQLAAANLDGVVQLWSVADGRLVRTIGRHEVEAWSVAISPDGTYLVSGSADNTAKIWSSQGALLHTLTGHQDAVYTVDINPAGDIVATSSIDGVIKLWHRDGTLIRTIQTGETSLFGFEFSPDGQILATVGADKSLSLLTLDGEIVHRVTDKAINIATFAPDGQMLATITDTSVELRQLSGELIRSMPLATEELTSLTDVAFSPDGNMLAATQWNNLLKAWQVKLWHIDGTEITTLVSRQREIDTIAFSPDGAILATGSFDKEIVFWNIEQILELDELTFACDWIDNYLQTSSELMDNERLLCQP